MSNDSVARLGEAQLDRLAEATWRAIAHVDPALSYADFLDLPFSVGELIQAFPVGRQGGGPAPRRCAGSTGKPPATPEASREAGKSISTP